jgi:hypothetical protein
MADRGQLVRARAVPVLVEAGEDRRIARVAEPLELRAQEAGPARVDALLALERPQRLEVVVEPPGVRVEDGELAADELRGVALGAEEPVAGELDLAVARERRVEVERVQPLDGAAVTPERRLAAGVPEELDDPVPAPGAKLEPVGRPERPEALAELRRAVLELLCLRPRDPLDRPGDEQLVGRVRLRIDPRAEPLRLLRQPGARVFQVPDQEATATASAAIRLSPVSGEKK